MVARFRGLAGVPVAGSSRSGPVGGTSGTVDVLSALAPSSPSAAAGAPAATLLLLATNWNLVGYNFTLPVSAEAVAVVVSGIPPGRTAGATATISLIDDTHGHAKPVWRAWGSPTYPNASEVAAELAASEVAAEPLPVTDGPGAGEVTLAFPLAVYATALVELTF